MQSVNARFLTAVARTAQSPTYYVEIDGVSSRYATHWLREPNIILDGGFETSGLPNWGTVLTGGTVNEDTVEFYEGTQSLRLTRTDSGTGGLAVHQSITEINVTQFNAGLLNRFEFVRYRLTFRSRTDSGSSFKPNVALKNLGNDPNYVNPEGRVSAAIVNPFSTQNDLTSTWQRYDIVFSVQREVGTTFSDSDIWQVNVRADNFNENTSVWYDAMRLEAADTRAPTKKVQLMPPTSTGVAIEPIDGIRTTQVITLTLLDAFRGNTSGKLVEDVTNLISTDIAGAEVASLINRKVTIFAGYRDLNIEDYEPIFVGRIRELSLSNNLTAYLMTVSDVSYLLDGEVFSNATEIEPTKIVGNVVNVFASVLRGIFSTSDADFPLTSVSTFVAGTVDEPDSGSSVPTGLGISDSLLDIVGMKAERDRWHLDDEVEMKLVDPVNAREYLREEFFRAFQAWSTITGDGKLGCRFLVPSLPRVAVPKIVTNDIVAIRSWKRDFPSHLNKFNFLGDYDPFTDEYSTVYDTVKSEDTADQTDTLETIEYRLESKWIRTTLNGLEISEELADRLRIRYLKTPAIIVIDVPFTQRLLEEGDVISFTYPHLPNLSTGSRGLVGSPMTIISIVPNFELGTQTFTLLDTGFKKYGVIAPDAQADFGSATPEDKGTFIYISDSAGLMGDGVEGYRFA